jgi:hypothetical protein
MASSAILDHVKWPCDRIADGFVYDLENCVRALDGWEVPALAFQFMRPEIELDIVGEDALHMPRCLLRAGLKKAQIRVAIHDPLKCGTIFSVEVVFEKILYHAVES